MRPLRIRPQALREIDDAFEWYRKRAPSAAASFLEELDAAFAQIAAAPEQHHVVRGRRRRVLLHRFLSGEYYKALADVVGVVGVIHGHRHPRNWLRRAAPCRDVAADDKGPPAAWRSAARFAAEL